MHSTRAPTWPGWVLVVPALAGWHEAVLVVRLGVGAVAGSTATGEHQEEGHGISPASRSTGLQRAGAGQNLEGQGFGVARHWAHPAVAAAGQRGAGPDRPAPARNSPGTPTWAAGCWSCRRWPGGTRWCWWPGWVLAWSPGSRAAGEHQAEGHGTSRASRSTGLAGQELDQLADVGGWVLVVACAGRDARGGAGGRAGCWRGRRIDGRRRAPGRRPRDQAGQPIDRAAAC
ncbi:hypothetical protein [Sphaerotilus sp.]|uniref:hypothetical protein n=1 Tax=Sphaerotilus sp. TaxID=2093942 RepID=UPI0025F4D62B|nr:hypothetical protein [Sphaerotilus sp.]